MNPKSLFAIAVSGLVISVTTAAYAGPISGDVELTGTFSKLPDVGTGAILSDLRFINIAHGALVDPGTGTGWFEWVAGGATANNINLDPLQPIHFTYVVNDPVHNVSFTFLATAVSNIVRGTLSCTDTACTDSLAFDIAGVVSGPGFFTTAFTGTWSGVGTCAALDNKCVSGVDGSWRAYLDPPLTPVVAAAVPEPGSVALLGLALGILAFMGRRKA